VKLCQSVANLYPCICANFGRFIVKNGVNFLQLLIVFLPFQVLSVCKSKYCDFIAEDEWLPIHSISNH